MKLIALILFAAGAVPSHAAESSPAPKDNSAATHITAKSVDFDLKSRQAVYRGNVTVLDPRINLTCELLTATLGANSGRVDSLVAESNVVATISTNNTVYTVTAAKAVYSYRMSPSGTNQTLELSGPPEPVIRWPQEGEGAVGTNEFAARRMLWDIGNGNIKAENHRGVFPNMDALNKVASPATATNATAITNP